MYINWYTSRLLLNSEIVQENYKQNSLQRELAVVVCKQSLLSPPKLGTKLVPHIHGLGLTVPWYNLETLVVIKFAYNIFYDPLNLLQFINVETPRQTSHIKTNNLARALHQTPDLNLAHLPDTCHLQHQDTLFCFSLVPRDRMSGNIRRNLILLLLLGTVIAVSFQQETGERLDSEEVDRMAPTSAKERKTWEAIKAGISL